MYSLFSRFFQQRRGAGVQVTPPILLQFRAEFFQRDRNALFHVIKVTLRQHVRRDLKESEEI